MIAQDSRRVPLALSADPIKLQGTSMRNGERPDRLLTQDSGLRHFVLKLKVTVKMNGVGIPFNTSGE